MCFMRVFCNSCTGNFGKNPEKYMLGSSLLIKLQDYSIQSTIGLKPPLQILVWKCWEKQRYSKFKNSKKTFAKLPLFSKVTGLQTRISDLTKTDSKKNVFCECFEIIGNLPSKGVMSPWVLIPPSKPQTSNFCCPSGSKKLEKYPR